MKVIASALGLLMLGSVATVQAQSGTGETKRFTHVNRDRDAVQKLYNQMYVPASDYPQGWTEPGNCNPGKLSAATLKARLTEINYFRKMAGLQPVSFNAEYNEKAQAAAYLMYKNGTLNHRPPTNWKCYTQLAASGASSCNLGYGGGIYGYITDLGPNNQDCGHRMYILSAQKEEMGYGGTEETDAIYVFGGIRDVDSLPNYVAWPPAGFIPSEILSDRWTFSHPGSGNYASATAEVSVNGKSVPLTYTQATSYGDGGMAFEIADWSEWKPKMLDQKVKVQIKGVKMGLETRSYTYEVIPFKASESGTVAVTYWDDESSSGTVDEDEGGEEPEVVPFEAQKLLALSELVPNFPLSELTIGSLKTMVARDLVYNEAYSKLAMRVSALRKEKNPDPARLNAWVEGKLKAYLAEKAGLSETQAAAALAPKFLVLEFKKLIPLGEESFGDIAAEFATKFAEGPDLKAFVVKYKRIRQCGVGFAVKRMDKNGKSYAGVYATLVVTQAGLRASS